MMLPTSSVVLFTLLFAALPKMALTQSVNNESINEINSVSKKVGSDSGLITAIEETTFEQANCFSVTQNASTNLPIDSVTLSPDYYPEKTYLLNYMDITVFFGKNISSINGKFYMAPENVSIASTPDYAHNPESDYYYHTGQSDYLYYCDSIKIRNNNEVFIPYSNYFSLYDHHLKFNTKYNLLFVGEIEFTDESKYTNTESDILASFNTTPIPDNKIKAKGTFEVADIENLGFSKKHLEDPTTDRYVNATYGKTAIHNFTPVSNDNITGNDINVAIVDLQIFKNSLVDKAVVYRSHPLEDELFVSKEKIALLTQDIDSILPLYNHGTQMARYMLNYAPKINIYNFNKAALMDDVFTDSLFADAIVEPENAIDIASFSGSSDAIEKLAEGVHDGLIVSRSLGNYQTTKNTFDNYQHKDILLPHYSPFLTGNNKASIKGAFVTLQGVIFSQCRPSKGPGDLCLNTATCVRAEAGDARYYTLSIIENGNGATSEATATFSGMVALMLEANIKYDRNFTPRQVVEILFQTAIDIGEAGVDSLYGWGVPDLGAALEVIKNNAPVTFSLYEVMEPGSTQTAVSDVFKDAFNFIIFPNPTTNKITIRLNTRVSNLESIKVFNAFGKALLVNSENFEGNVIKLDLEHFPSGMYIVKCFLKNGSVSSQKMIKE